VGLCHKCDRVFDDGSVAAYTMLSVITGNNSERNYGAKSVFWLEIRTVGHENPGR